MVPIVFMIILSSLLILNRNEVQASVDIPPFGFEGEQVLITIRLDGDVDEDLVLEEYEFHYIMHPSIAPKQDTWPHEKQMEYMQNVLDEKLAPYVPSLDDENIKKILEISPKKSYTLRQSGGGAYALEWNATHGRIFFRLKVGDKYIEDLYTTRVHCKHIDMRSFENLKDTLNAMAMPIKHRNSMMVESVFERAHSIYTKGHSPVFMLRHHEYPIEDLDGLFESLGMAIKEGDLDETENLRRELLRTLVEKEDLFYKLDLRVGRGTLFVDIYDTINDFSFYNDPNTEVYIKRIDPAKETTGLMAELHDPEKHDHSQMNQPLDRGKLLEGALPLSKVNGIYKIGLGENFKGQKLDIIVIYGPEQNYYLTRAVSI